MQAKEVLEIFLRIYNVYVSNILDILILAYVFYKIILFIKGTKAMQIVVGILILLVFTVLARDVFHLRAITWVLNNFWIAAVLIFAIVFQNEIRNVLAHLGANIKIFSPSTVKDELINSIIGCVQSCSQTKTGVLIAIENETGLKSLTETGVILNANMSEELLLSIFKDKNAPLHDGAVIISSNKIYAAGCILPLSDNTEVKLFGTRHRAALGLSEVSDALVIAVSEESGLITVAYNSNLISGVSVERLVEILKTKGSILKTK
ncbi:MAG: diadenylate cyclase CdaA [Elusimicrobiota bacterium]|jgi:diadenylate cyclase|nr:diadenylate cyclase CdaA [Elusimicrobiota bacterium]